MDNGANKDELEFTLLGDKHKGWLVEWAIVPSRSEPGNWMGHFHAFKEGFPTIRRSIADLYDNPATAQNETIRFAKQAVDEATADK